MSNAQVFVVEDENIVAKAIQAELRGMGYHVSGVASSGEDAIRQVAETHPDVVLMDIILKGDMDGIEAAHQVRQRYDVPVVFLTAYGDDDTLERAKTSEPYGYLLKPYEEQELHTTIEMTLYKHRLERRLRERHQWLAATLDGIHDAVIATDGRQYVRLLNPRAARLTGWTVDDALGCDLTEVCGIRSPQFGACLEQGALKSIHTGRGAELPTDAVIVARDGRETPVEGSLAPIHDDEGNFTGLVLTLRDVSERRLFEKVRRQSDDHLRQAQKMEAVSRLAGGVAHDFNNLLTVILGNASLVLSRLPATDPNLQPMVQVEAATLRAAEQVKQLLGFSGRTSLWLEPINLNDSIRELLQLLRETMDIGIRIEFAPSQDLWPVRADPPQMREVLMNLCLNARDALPEGGRVRLETSNVVLDEDYLRRCPQAQPGEYVRLRVQDNGHGIAPDIQGRIFEPFFTTKEPGQGKGLGLALVFGTIHQHRGWIDCFSEPGRGTCFDVYLPRCAPQPTLPPAPATAPHPRAAAETILLADDEPMIRNLARAVLQPCGYQVLLAGDGREAVEIYRREWQRIDLVILDLTMPRLSGEDALRHMIDVDPGVRVLFSSGYFADHVSAQGEQVLGFLGKPYRPAELLRTVRDALEYVAEERKQLGSANVFA